MSDDPKLQILHDAAHSRFTTVVDAMTARLDYRLDGRTLSINHTEVPEPLQGRGIAGALVAEAVRHARANALVVVPNCSYARSWMERHPQSRDVLAR